jgi:hypothetical protein
MYIIPPHLLWTPSTPRHRLQIWGGSLGEDVTKLTVNVIYKYIINTFTITNIQFRKYHPYLNLNDLFIILQMYTIFWLFRFPNKYPNVLKLYFYKKTSPGCESSNHICHNVKGEERSYNGSFLILFEDPIPKSPDKPNVNPCPRPLATRGAPPPHPSSTYSRPFLSPPPTLSPSSLLLSPPPLSYSLPLLSPTISSSSVPEC